MCPGTTVSHVEFGENGGEKRMLGPYIGVIGQSARRGLVSQAALCPRSWGGRGPGL